jgi:hypothetical protein
MARSETASTEFVAVTIPTDCTHVVGANQTRQAQALREWNPSDLPRWLDEDAYRREILPHLAKFIVRVIRWKISVTHPYATLVRRGEKIPHPRHCMPLAELSGYEKRTV